MTFQTTCALWFTPTERGSPTNLNIPKMSHRQVPSDSGYFYLRDTLMNPLDTGTCIWSCLNFILVILLCTPIIHTSILHKILYFEKREILGDVVRFIPSIFLASSGMLWMFFYYIVFLTDTTIFIVKTLTFMCIISMLQYFKDKISSIISIFITDMYISYYIVNHCIKLIRNEKLIFIR